MEYKFTPAGENYAPYASGGVFYSAPGHPAFPVRLAVEVFRRCLHWRVAAGVQPGPCVLYDPCCGGAYHLATLPWFNWEHIAAIYASDIDADALAVAARNMALLTPDGMELRVAELGAMHRQWGKASHAEALEYAHLLQARLGALAAGTEGHTIPTRLFCADATDAAAVRAGLAGATVDIVLTDLPYGQASQWQFSAAPKQVLPAGEGTPAERLLAALLPALAPGAVVAVAANKGEKIGHAAYRRLERLSVGKRQIVVLHPLA
jgi:hypothetical protein